VVNNSATLPAAVSGRLADGVPIELRFAGPAPDLPRGEWGVGELRSPDGAEPFEPPPAPQRIELPAGARVTTIEAYTDGNRLWLASIRLRGGGPGHPLVHGPPPP